MLYVYASNFCVNHPCIDIYDNCFPNLSLTIVEKPVEFRFNFEQKSKKQKLQWFKTCFYPYEPLVK
jgi:hypothetical protein